MSQLPVFSTQFHTVCFVRNDIDVGIIRGCLYCVMCLQLYLSFLFQHKDSIFQKYQSTNKQQIIKEVDGGTLKGTTVLRRMVGTKLQNKKLVTC